MLHVLILKRSKRSIGSNDELILVLILGSGNDRGLFAVAEVFVDNRIKSSVFLYLSDKLVDTLEKVGIVL